jgi:hypothetical protein
MTLDLTFNVPSLVAIGAAIITVIVWLIRLEGRVDKNAGGLAELTKTTAALEALVNLTREQFHEYQLQAAKDYVTQQAVNEIKRDLIDEMKAMERRVELQVDRAIKAAKGQ